MTIADVPGEPQKVVAGHLHQVFGRRRNGNEAAVVKGEGIAVVQMCGSLQIDEKAQTRFGCQHFASQETILVSQMATVR